MNGWIIAADGSAVNLRHVTHVLVEKRSHADDSWYVLGRPAGIALVTGLDSREAATTWIERHFRDFDQHAAQAEAIVSQPRSLYEIINDEIMTNTAKFEEARAAGYGVVENPFSWSLTEWNPETGQRPYAIGQYELRKPVIPSNADKTLAGLLADAIYGMGEFSLGVDDERVPPAEGVGLIVGVVQGWLAGEREKDTVNRDVYGTIDELIREAGRGLGVEDATSS